MATTTLTSLLQLLGEGIGDYLTFDTTTNITTNKLVVSTTLQQYDGGQDGYFDDWWVYIDGTNNSGVHRKTGSTTYATATGTLYVYGANLASESGNVTCYLHRFNRDNKKLAINRAIEQLSGVLFKRLEGRTLVTGNVLPDNSFEMWTSASLSSFYSTDNATLARTTTAGLIRGLIGTTSMKVTADSANGYAVLNSDDYPRLLDLMGKNIDFKCWAYPEVADDASIVIYTKQADGTEQTLTSTTSCPAGEFTLLELEDQQLNDDLAQIEIRFKVATNTKYTYFDSARVIGDSLFEYLLLSDFDTGEVSQVYVQASGYSDDICDDLNPRYWDRQEFTTIHDGTYLYLRLRNIPTNNKQIRIIGTTPLGSLSADTDTISISGAKLNLIVAKAAAILYRLEQGPVSSEDKGRYFTEINIWESEYRKLVLHHMMAKPSTTIFTGD